MCAPIPQGKWSWKFDRCVECKTTKVKHKGRGLCLKCHDKQRDFSHKRKIQKKNNHNRWYNKVKKTSEYITYTNNRAAQWRKTKAYKSFLKRRYKVLKYRRIILNQINNSGRILKRNKGIKIAIDGKIIVTPFQDLEHEINELTRFKNEYYFLCQKKQI